MSAHHEREQAGENAPVRPMCTYGRSSCFVCVCVCDCELNGRADATSDEVKAEAPGRRDRPLGTKHALRDAVVVPHLLPRPLSPPRTTPPPRPLLRHRSPPLSIGSSSHPGHHSAHDQQPQQRRTARTDGERSRH